ncbi:MAG: hypothetical protein GXD23_11775 [Comamonadaceae bacterium]|jgi:hypothetical protein|nr:hypothetical protein [Comamonadaceae bacterium]
MISRSSPKQYKLDAALPGQAQATPLRQVVEAAVNKTEKDQQPRVLYLKTTAPSSDRTAQPYITTKFDSRHEDPQTRATQPRKLKQTQHQGATAQLKGLTTSWLKLPSAPREAQRAAQDLGRLCASDSTQVFGLPCTPELLQQLKRMESAQVAPRSTASTPRQPSAHTPRSNTDRSPRHPPTDEDESSTASQTTVSLSEESSPPNSGGTPRKVKTSRVARLPVKQVARQNLNPIRQTYLDQQKLKQKQKREQALLDLQDLMFPPEKSLASPHTQVGAPTLQLPLLPVGRDRPSTLEPSEEPAPPGAQSDRPRSNVEPIPEESLRTSKSQSTPTSPTPPDQPPPTSPRGPLKPQRVPRPSLRSRQTPTPPATPGAPPVDPASPPTTNPPETLFNEQ